MRKAFWIEDEISSEEFRNEFELARQQARAEQGEAFDARAFESTENKLRVLDLKRREVLDAVAVAQDAEEVFSSGLADDYQ